MPRLDTSLESTGAEFLVLGHLLAEGIQAYKAYTNFPGYDITATNPDKNRSCRIQVKSRWATDFDGGFPIKNFDCDFVVLAALNRGFRGSKRKLSSDSGRRVPQLYVFPVDIVKAAQDPRSGWGKVFLKNMKSPEEYIENWGLVKSFLGIMNFKREDLIREGFEGFVSIKQFHRDGFDSVPAGGGVYVVLREINGPPDFLPKSTANRRRGKDPTVRVDKLKSRWVDGAHMMYIGKGKDLRRRVRQLLNFGFGKHAPHWGGRLIWQIERPIDFIVAWKLAGDSEDPSILKSQLLRDFRATYKSLPFANLTS